MIFVAQDVGQDREAVAFLDQAHGDAGHVRFQRHAGIHECQAAAADGSHRARAIGFRDFRNDPHGISEFVGLGQYRKQRTLGKAAVSDFAPLRRAYASGFTGRIGREIIMQHETVAVFTL